MAPVTEAVETLETPQDRLRESADWSRSIDIEGAAAWNELQRYQAIIVETGLSVLDEDSYKIGGFASRADFEETMSGHAMDEAARLYDLAQAKVDDINENKPVAIEDLPWQDMKAAFEWLKKSGKPLLDDTTYEAIGAGSRADFFDVFRSVHIHAARQKIGRASLLRDEPDEGMALMESALKDNLAPVGLGEDSPELVKYVEVDGETFSAIYASHVKDKFRKQIEALEGWRRFKRTNTPEYQDAVLAAAETLEKSAQLETYPDLFQGLKISREVFADEVLRCADMKLARLVSELAVGNYSGEFLDEQTKKIIALHDLFEIVPAPEDTPVEFLDEDFWCANILKQFGFRSYTHLFEQLHILGAQATINNTLGDRNMGLADAHDALLEGVTTLKEVGFAVNDGRALDSIGIDRTTLTRTFLEATFEALYRDWDILHTSTMDTEGKLRLLENMADGMARVTESDDTREVPFTYEEKEEVAQELKLRRAEEIIAEFLICLETAKGFNVLYDAYQIFDELEVDMMASHIHGPMGMSQAFAHHIDDRFGMMELADIWMDAIDESLDIDQRFDAAKSVASKLKELEEEQVSMLTSYLGLDMPPRAGVLLNDLAGELYLRSMAQAEEAGIDPVNELSFLQTAAECLEAMNPNALKDDAAYHATTGKLGRKIFTGRIKALQARVDALNTPLTIAFRRATGVSEDLVKALEPQNRGKRAFDLMADAARALREEGRSILDGHILSPLGMSPESLTAFLDEQVLMAAREHVDAAHAAKGNPLTIETLENHSYQHFRNAYGAMVLHSRGTVLSDTQWRKMGFASRLDFMDQCREALLDCVTQMENLAETPQAMRMGPYGLLRLMNEIRGCYRALGMESLADIPDFNDIQTTTARGGSIETTQRAIHKMAPAACWQVLNEKRPLKDGETEPKDTPASLRFKKLRFIYEFAFQMRTTTWDGRGKLANTNAAYDGVVRERIEQVVKRYAKQKGTPARAARLALAVKDMAETYKFENDEWFQDLFLEMNYRDFNSFCDYAAVQRIRQIVDRTLVAMKGSSTDGQLDDATHLGILRDMMRIESLSDENGLVTERRRDGIFRELDVDPEWHRLQMAVSAQFAVPLMLREADDPTIEDSERWAIIEDTLGVLSRIGRARTREIKLDKKHMARTRGRTVRRMAAHSLFEDMLRVETDVMSQHIGTAATMLAQYGKRFADADFSRRIGLRDDELERLQYQESKLEPFGLARSLYDTPANDMTANYVVINSLYEAFGAAEMNPHDPEHLRVLGIVKPAEFSEMLETRTLDVLKDANVQFAALDGNAERQVEFLNMMLRFLEMTDIESRIGEDALEEKAIFTRDQVMTALMITVPKMPVPAYQAPVGQGRAPRPTMA